MASIFTSYRRRPDSEGYAGRIVDRLRLLFRDTVEVHLDVDGAIEAGEPFPEKLRSLVVDADVVLSVVGRTWLDEITTRTAAGQDDWVRTELTLAQAHNRRIIPVLVGGASMPAADGLPDELKFFSGLNALTVRHDAFDSGVAAVAAAIRGILGARPVPHPQYMWWSTSESINADIPSITAIIETVLAVIAYWWIAVRYETYWPLIVGALAAPLVLLRSDASIATGLRWFEKWQSLSNRDPDARWQPIDWVLFALVFIVVAFAGLVIGATYFRLNKGPLTVIASYCFFALVAASTLFGAIGGRSVVPGAVCGWLLGFASILLAVLSGPASRASFALEITDLPGKWSNDIFKILFFGIPLSIGAAYAVGLSFTVMFLRSSATLQQLWAGFRSMPRNLRRIALCASPIQEPELIPGLPHGHKFRLSNVFSRVLHVELWWEPREGRGVQQKDTEDWGIPGKAALFATMVILFLPAWFYRISIKSTVWLWWPVAFVGGPARAAARPDLFRRLEIETLWGRTTVVLAIAAIGAFAWINLAPDILDQVSPVPHSLLAVVFLPEPTQAVPWQLLGPAFGVLSVVIVLWLDRAHARYDEARKAFDLAGQGLAKVELQIVEIVGRLRSLMVLAFILLVGAFMAATVNARAAPNCWVAPGAVAQGWGQWIYGHRMPPAPLCHLRNGALAGPAAT